MKMTREEVETLPSTYRIAVPRDDDVFVRRDVLERLRVTALSAMQEAETWKELANNAEAKLRRAMGPPPFGVVDGEPYCLDCGGKPGDHSDECTQGDLAIKVPSKLSQDRCVCGHDKDEHHPCGSCENRCGCLNYRTAAG